MGKKRRPLAGASGQRQRRWGCCTSILCGTHNKVKGARTKRVIVYIDGFNLYFGMRAKGWKKYYWLDLRRMSRELLKPDQQLAATRYFTSRVSQPPEKSHRQDAYLQALGTLPPAEFSITYGQYETSLIRCSLCGRRFPHPSEKMTDVNIAVAMLSDAYHDRFDTAILVSGDSDLTAPILEIRQEYPLKRVVVAFPPDRHSKRLEGIAPYITAPEQSLRRSQFPDVMILPNGSSVFRPPSWRTVVSPVSINKP